MAYMIVKPIISSVKMMALILSLFIQGSICAEEIKIFALLIDGLHQTNGKGKYDKIINKLKISDLQVVSPKRAFSEFHNDNCLHCCLTPANKNTNFYEYGDNYITSNSMNMAAIYIWSAPKLRATSDLSDLKGKRVGGRFGMPYGNKVKQAVKNGDFTLTLNYKIETSIKLINSNRLDYFLAYTPDACKALKKLNFPLRSYIKESPISTHQDRVLCKKTAKTEAFIKELNKLFVDQSKVQPGCNN